MIAMQKTILPNRIVKIPDIFIRALCRLVRDRMELLLIMIPAVLPAAAAAQATGVLTGGTPDTLSASVPSVSVTGTRAPLAVDQAARTVDIITREEIAASGATSVNDLLKLTAGVDVRQRGAFGVQGDISINGGTFDQITILLNGVNINNPQTGHLVGSFPVSTDDIERIEILEGAAGRLFGSQAFSGAINIVTRNVKQNCVGANISAGSFGTYENGIGLGLKTEATTHYISGNYRRSDGGADNSNFQQGRAFYNGKYKGDDVRIDWQAGFLKQDYGANTFYSAAYPNQWESNSQIIVSAKAETEGNIHFAPQISWLHSNDHFQLTRNSPAGENFHRNDVFTVSANAWTKWAIGRTAIGAEIRNEGILSSSLGRPLDSARYVKIHGCKDKYYTHSDSRTNISYFLEHDVVLRQFTISAGIMVNRNTAVDHKFRFYPGIDVSYRPSRNMRFTASWNQAMRLPTFTDLYYKSPTEEGNAGLCPEKTSSFRISGEYRTHFLRLTAQGYYSHGTDMIDWVMRAPNDIYHSANFTLDNYGFTIDADLDFNHLFGRELFLKNLSVSYAYIYQDRRDDQYVYRSNYAMEYLRHKLVVMLNHRIFSRLEAAWTLRWQEREGAYIEYSGGESTGRLVKYSPYALLNLKLRWNAPKYEIYVSADNLLSHRYYDLGNILQPGCWIMAGAKLNLML